MFFYITGIEIMFFGSDLNKEMESYLNCRRSTEEIAGAIGRDKFQRAGIKFRFLVNKNMV